MTEEFDGCNKQNLKGSYDDILRFESEAVVKPNRIFTSIDLNPSPQQLLPSSALGFCRLEFTGEYPIQEVGIGYNIRKTGRFDGIPDLEWDIPLRPMRIITGRFDGIFALEWPVPLRPMRIISCYLATDKLALVARLKTVDKVPLGNMISIFIGNHYKEVVQSTEKGIAYGYLNPDNYYNTIVISPNGIVYQEVNRSQDQAGTYDITLGRVTKANAPFRMPHRKFV